MGDGPTLWLGAAGLCIDAHHRVLLVLQGKPDERKAWALPGGGKQPHETLAACCVREVWEETGYRVGVVRELAVKRGSHDRQPFELHIYEVALEGGEATLHDPDGLIDAVAWCSAAEVERLAFGFPEDKDLVRERLARRMGQA